MKRLLLLTGILCAFLSYARAQAVDLVPLFDTKLTKYYKVDTCRMYENVSSDGKTIQYLRKVYLFNKEGLVTQEIEFGQSDYEGHTITKYDYNANGQVITRQVLKPDREPVVTNYTYQDNRWTGMTVTYPFIKEYEVQSTDQGLVLGIIGRAMIQEQDSLTGEPTGREIMGNIEEYEFRYNRHYKVVKESFYYYGRDYHVKTYEYPPNGYGPPVSMSFFKPFEKNPEYKTIYTYDGRGFRIMEVTNDMVSGYKTTLEYEYAFAPDSPVHDKAPEVKQGQQFWIGKKPK